LNGNRSKIDVCEIYDWGLADYALASRKDFLIECMDEAIDYAKSLAKRNGLTYVGDGYLD